MTPREPRVVAELGRPETPDETAARKAESSRKHRENQTFFNLIIALIASAAVAAVLFIIVFPSAPPPAEPIDVAAEAEASSLAMGTELLAPELPEDWWANAAEIREGSDEVFTWYAGYVTPEVDFVSMTQAVDANATWTQLEIEQAIPTGEVTIDGIDWTIYDQRGVDNIGNNAFIMTAEHGANTVILAGTAEEEEFALFAAAVSENLADLPAN